MISKLDLRKPLCRAAGFQAPGSIISQPGEEATSSFTSPHRPHRSLGWHLNPSPGRALSQEPLPVSSSDHKAVYRCQRALGARDLHVPRRSLTANLRLVCRPHKVRTGPVLTEPTEKIPNVCNQQTTSYSVQCSNCKNTGNNLKTSNRGRENLPSSLCTTCGVSLMSEDPTILPTKPEASWTDGTSL